jgi:hypothetical protein
MSSEQAHGISKRGRLGEGRPTKRTPEVVAKIAEAVAIGLTDEEAGLLAGINPDTMTEWRKDPEFSGALKRATAERLLMRLERIEAGEQGWQGTAWALERLYPHRFARPEVMNQIAVVNQGGKASAERVIVLPGEDFDALTNRPGYRLRENGDLERREGRLVYVMVRQQSNRALPMGE